MKTDRMREWTAELRTTDKKQGKGWLASKKDMAGDDLHYCCLGIGCELAGVKRLHLTLPDGLPYQSFGNFHQAELAPAEFVEWLFEVPAPDRTDSYDLTPDWGEVGDLPQQQVGSIIGQSTLASLNDEGFTFAQIADIIDHFGLLFPENIKTKDWHPKQLEGASA